MVKNEWPVEFVGRQEELATLTSHIQAWNTRRFVFIDGPGGIGKTRLLEEVEKRFVDLASELPIKILPIIDFDDDRYKFSQNIGISIGRQLDPGAFEEYFGLLRDLRLAEEQADETDSPLLGRKFLAINREFAKAFNSVSQQRRVILRFDTTETVGDSVMLSYVFDIGKNLQNTLVVLAGRNAKTLYERYESDLASDAFLLSLAPFGAIDFRDYLEAKRRILGVHLEDEWLEKLFLVAGGVPVLVDMAIEWAQTNRRLNWLDEWSRVDLEKLRQEAMRGENDTYAELQHRLRKEIVMPIAELQSEFDYLQFLLAKVYPLDRDGVAAMLNLDSKRVQAVMKQAYQSVAIKRLSGGRIKLHDEIQDLVRAHVWPYRDPDNKWEQRDSLRAVKYLRERASSTLQRIRQLKGAEEAANGKLDLAESMTLYVERAEKEAEFWTLRLEHLRRQIALDVQVGFQVFENDIELARREVASPSARMGLLDTISPYAHLESPQSDIHGRSLSSQQCMAILTRRAKQSFFNGVYDAANREYDQLLEHSQEGSALYIELLQGKANSLLRLGRSREALDVNQRALRLADQYPDHKIKITISAGWINRRMGNLDQAVKYYGMALDLAFKHNDVENAALAFQNQAYVHALQDKERTAMDEVKRAIRTWRKLIHDGANLSFRLGQAYNTAGEICLEFERPQEALEFFGLSWNIFTREESGRPTWHANSRSGSGFAHWQLAISALKDDHMQLADLELSEAAKALEWAATNADAIDQPVTQNRLAEVYFLQKRWDKARANWQESRDVAHQIGDAFNELHSLSDLVRLAFYFPMDEYTTWTDFKQHYDDWRRRYQVRFDVLEGLFSTYLGHLALRDHLIDDAVELYSRGLVILSSGGTYTPFNLIGQLDFIERELMPHLSASEVGELCDRLCSRWIEGGHDRIALGYFHEWLTNARASVTSSGGIT